MASLKVDLSDPALIRYMRSRSVSVSSGCVEWTGDRAHGYGVVNFKKARQLAHRVALELSLGRYLSYDEIVCHQCDNKCCVCREHLFVGTRGDNNRDSSAKGRRGKKLTPAKAAEILARYRHGDGSYEMLAKDYGVCGALVRDIVKGRSWQLVLDHKKKAEACPWLV